jgi:uncharacterized protein
MRTDPVASPPGRRGGARLALACVLAWCAAAVAASTLGIWVGIGGAAIALGALVVAAGGGDVRALLTPSARLVGFGLAAGAATILATYGLYPLLVALAPGAVLEAEILYAAFRAPSLLVASLALAPIILGEELVWRGVVQGELARRLGPWGGALAAALLYALVSIPIGSPLLVLVSLGLGIAWGVLRVMTRSLVPTLVAHVAWNAVVLLWLPLDLV